MCCTTLQKSAPAYNTPSQDHHPPLDVSDPIRKMYSVPDVLPHLYKPDPITLNGPATAQQWGYRLKDCQVQIREAYRRVEEVEKHVASIDIEHNKLLDRVLDYKDYLLRNTRRVKSDDWFLENLELKKGQDWLEEIEEKLKVQQQLATHAEQELADWLAKGQQTLAKLLRRVADCVDSIESMTYAVDAANTFKLDFTAECTVRRGDLNAARYWRQRDGIERQNWRSRRFEEHEEAKKVAALRPALTATSSVPVDVPSSRHERYAGPLSPILPDTSHGNTGLSEFLFNRNASARNRARLPLFTPRTDDNQKPTHSHRSREHCGNQTDGANEEPPSNPQTPHGKKEPAPQPKTIPKVFPRPRPRQYRQNRTHQPPIDANHCTKVYKPEPPNVFDEWQQSVNTSLQDCAAMMVFPDPPAGHCQLLKCKYEERTLTACEHDIRHAFEQVKGLNLKRERLRWHPDRFSVCHELKRERFQKRASEVFTVVSAMFLKAQQDVQ